MTNQVLKPIQLISFTQEKSNKYNKYRASSKHGCNKVAERVKSG